MNNNQTGGVNVNANSNIIHNNNGSSSNVTKRCRRTTRKRWNCNHCSEHFPDAKKLHQHQEMCHPELVTSPCPDCGKRYGQQDLLVHHRKYAHKSRIATGVSCKKQFKNEPCRGEVLIARCWKGNVLYPRWGVDKNKPFFNYTVCNNKRAQHFEKLSTFKQENPLHAIWNDEEHPLVFD
eukprot:514028_1